MIGLVFIIKQWPILSQTLILIFVSQVKGHIPILSFEFYHEHCGHCIQYILIFSALHYGLSLAIMGQR